jgi:hypothetical protein
MNRLRKMMTGALMLSVGASVFGQEPGAAAVRLGMPTPLADSAGVVGSFVPLPAPVVPNRALPPRSNVRPLPPPTVVRAASAVFDDEPKQPLLPIFLPPVEEAKPRLPVRPALPASPDLPTVPVVAPPEQKIDPDPQPIKPVQNKQTIIDIGTNGKLTVIADSAQDGAPGTAKPPIVAYDDSALIGGSKNPVWNTHDANPGWIDFGWTADPGPADRFYVGAEWLQWWARGMHLPPLVTTASPTDNPATIGALGFQSTRLIYGDNTVLNGSQPGGRFTVGYNFDPCGICAIEATFFFLGQNTDNAFFGSNQFPVIARPFFDINTGTEFRQVTTLPGLATGNLQVHMASDLWGGEINNRLLLWDCCDFQLTGLVGFRYLNLYDRLGIDENSLVVTGVAAPLFNVGDKILVFDQFATHNQFYGGQIGAAAEWQHGPWSLDAHVKLGLGVTEQSADIEGGQQINRATGVVQNFQGGLYALPSNIGVHTQSRVGFVPDVGLKLGYDLTDHIRLFVGYDLLYWSSVLRAADQIDTTLDQTKIPNFGAPPLPLASQVRPVAPMQTTAYWAQGINAGILFRY